MWRGTASTGGTTQVINSQTGLQILDPVSDDIADATIMRIIGTIHMRPLAANAASFYRIGLITLDADAFAAIALPEPWVDPAAWMYETSGELLTDTLLKPDSIHRLHIDVKVMRRMLQQARTLVMIIECLAGSAGAFNWFASFKCLLRIP